MRERLKVPLAEEFITYILEPTLVTESKRSYEHMVEVNKAHVLMLVSQGIISHEVGNQLFAVLESMGINGAKTLELNPDLEDLYFNMEAFIIQQLGVHIGGQLHTGRSRNDISATVTRMNTRLSLLNIEELLLKLRYSLLGLAEKNTAAVMTGYTHLQPAEPITFAHYISAILHALERDHHRLEQAWKHVNVSPLGAAAMASTTFPINRFQTAELLGFDGILSNSLDSVAARDYVLEILAALNILMLNLSRFCHDLYVWLTDEFAFVEVGDSVAFSSSIMPQKKNPVTVEHVKAKASHILGILVSASTSLKNIPYTHCRDASTESIKYFWDALFEVEAALQVLIATVNTLKLNKEIMLQRAASNYSTVTELANTLVRETDLSFREAHQVVAKLVTYSLEHNKSVQQIDSALLKDIAIKVLGKELTLTDQSIKSALEPTLNVNGKSTLGGPSPTEVQSQLKNLKEKMDMHSTTNRKHRETIDRAKELLAKEAIHLFIEK